VRARRLERTGRSGVISRFGAPLVYRVLELPLFTEKPKNAIKKRNRAKQPREKEKKTEGRKATVSHIFCDKPKWIFLENVLFVFFALPLLRSA
jgi:hypothetical protein